jgi:excisionase family DNA binding protein
MEKNYLTIEETAEKLSVSQKTIRRYINNGKISAQKIGGIWRIYEESLTDYVASCHTNDSSSASKDDFCIYMDSEYFQSNELIQVCTIVDYFVQEDQAVDLIKEIMEVVVKESIEKKTSRFNYVYDDADNKMRLVFWGLPSYIEKVIKVMKPYERLENE